MRDLLLDRGTTNGDVSERVMAPKAEVLRGPQLPKTRGCTQTAIEIAHVRLLERMAAYSCGRHEAQEADI